MKTSCAFVLVASLLFSCRWSRADKIGGPEFAPFQGQVPLHAPVEPRRGAQLEVQVLSASVTETRTVLGLERCAVDLTLRLRNLTASRYDVMADGNGFKTADRRFGTFVYAMNFAERSRFVEAGQQVEVTHQLGLLPYACENPVSLVMGGAEIAVTR
jgi:hypothetical protein